MMWSQRRNTIALASIYLALSTCATGIRDASVQEQNNDASHGLEMDNGDTKHASLHANLRRNAAIVSASTTIQGGIPCGPSVCYGKEWCCNDSCGICTERRGCHRMLCTDSSPKTDDNDSIVCGPTLCMAEQECCNYDCGLCTHPGEPCPMMWCPPYVAPGQEKKTLSITPRQEETVKKVIQCGPSVCKAGQVCCNKSCGICTRPGGFCKKKSCGVKSGRTRNTTTTNVTIRIRNTTTTAAITPLALTAEKRVITCGSSVCEPGQVCCNPSCGICAYPGHSCIDLHCDSL